MDPAQAPPDTELPYRAKGNRPTANEGGAVGRSKHNYWRCLAKVRVKRPCSPGLAQRVPGRIRAVG
jgi:hypothetical protein